MDASIQTPRPRRRGVPVEGAAQGAQERGRREKTSLSRRSPVESPTFASSPTISAADATSSAPPGGCTEPLNRLALGLEALPRRVACRRRAEWAAARSGALGARRRLRALLGRGGPPRRGRPRGGLGAAVCGAAAWGSPSLGPPSPRQPLAGSSAGGVRAGSADCPGALASLIVLNVIQAPLPRCRLGRTANRSDLCAARR